VNELAKIFNLMGIDTNDVLDAAGTKWNFLKFKPGLVGGHCIGVDPYYLAQKSQELGYHPEIILAGRRMNDGMGSYLAKEVVKCMIKKGLALRNARVLILGITFKENCPDVRNTKIVDVVAAFKDYGLIVDVFDPWANKEEVKSEYQIELIGSPVKESYDAVVLGVAHKEFEKLDVTLFKKSQSVVYDVKGVLSSDLIDARL
jgi:UDP-N-acetyl-D-galactosamine dehydrogenase